jgi:predicted transcriptional regulator
MDDQGAVEQTAQIVAAYVAKNFVSLTDLPALISSVHKALAGATGMGGSEPEAAKPPAVTVRRSIQQDYLVCLEDGRKFKSLKRHLRTDHDLSPEGYRAKWGLPKTYPMVAPSYSLARSDLAKAMGLGVGGRKPRVAEGTATTKAPLPAPDVASPRRAARGSKSAGRPAGRPGA